MAGYWGWMNFVAEQTGRPQPVETLPFDWARHTVIGNDVWLGYHAVIKDGLQIGDGAIVGGHAMVAHDVPAYGVVAGNPARAVRMRFR